MVNLGGDGRMLILLQQSRTFRVFFLLLLPKKFYDGKIPTKKVKLFWMVSRHGLQPLASRALSWIQCKLGKQYLVMRFTLPWESNPGPFSNPGRCGNPSSVGLKKTCGHSPLNPSIMYHVSCIMYHVSCLWYSLALSYLLNAFFAFIAFFLPFHENNYKSPRKVQKWSQKSPNFAQNFKSQIPYSVL